MYHEELLQTIRSLDLTITVGQYTQLKKRGTSYEGKCPFPSHDDHDPSFHVYPDNRYKCFGCGKHGDMIEFYKEIKSLSFPDAMVEIAKDHYLQSEKGDLSKEELEKHWRRQQLFDANRFFQKWFEGELKESTGEEAWKYALSRWSQDIIEAWGIGYSPSDSQKFKKYAEENGYAEEILIQAGLLAKPDNEPSYAFFRDRLIIPLTDSQHRIVGFAGRILKEDTKRDNEDRKRSKYLNSRNNDVYTKSNYLFGISNAKGAILKSRSVYLAEGYTDVMRMQNIGIPNAVGLSGTALTENQIKFLKQHVDSVTIIGDTDDSGQASVIRSAELLIRNGIVCKFIPLPETGKKLDADSFFTSQEQFSEYAKQNVKDYILWLWGKQTNGKDLLPDELGKVINDIADLLACLPVHYHDSYFKKLKNKDVSQKRWEIGVRTSLIAHKSNENQEQEDDTEAKKKHDFYTITKNRDGEFKDLKIDRVKLIGLIKSLGFFRYDITTSDFRFVHIKDKTITEVSTTTITDAVEDYVDLLPDLDHKLNGTTVCVSGAMIKQKLFNGIQSYFSQELLKRSKPSFEIQLKKDIKDEKFFFFKNGFVTINQNEIIFRDYIDMDGYIWSSQIIQRNFVQNPKEKEIAVFESFMFNVAGKKQDRMLALKTMIGYALHNFSETKRKALVFTDSGIGAGNDPNGRTGKTLLCRGIGHMLNANEDSKVYVEESGKNFQPKNKFKYQMGALETLIVHINDLSGDFSIEILFTDITEGIEVDKKNEKPFKIRPKILLTTNRMFPIDGESAKDRVIVFEFADLYSSSFSPENEFNQWFFRDWDDTEWNAFDQLMISCVQEYFLHGLVVADEINLSSRILREKTNSDFVNFMDDCLSGKFDAESGLIKIVPGERIQKKELLESFKKNCPDGDNLKCTSKRFTDWVRAYGRYTYWNVSELRSNAKSYFIFEDPENKLSNAEESIMSSLPEATDDNDDNPF